MQRKPEPNWDDLRVFLALFRATTVVKAGAQLRIDGSTVSRRLAALEEALQVVLFERTRSGMLPTEAAEQLLPLAEEMELSMARLLGEVETLAQQVTGTVRVTCPPDAAEVLVLPHLPALRAAYPQLRIELDGRADVLDVARREADIAIRLLRPEHGDLVVTALRPIRWLPAASPQTATSKGTIKAWDSLPWVFWRDGDAPGPVATWVRKHLTAVEPVLRSDSLHVQLAAVMQGQGVALLPEPSIAHHALRALRPSRTLASQSGPWPEHSMYLVTHSRLRRVPRVQVVWERLKAALGPSGQV